MIREFIEKDKPYLNPLFGVSQLASHFEVGHKTIIRWCKSEYGKCPKVVIRECRIFEAKEVINGGYHGKLSQLHQLVGFQTSDVFYKTFKRVEKMTPGEYQKLKKL